MERNIIIGLITSTEYLQKIREIFDPKFLESEMARRIAEWCLEYFDQFNEAPGKHIQDIYYEKLEQGLPQDIAEEIEEDILPGLSEEFVKEGLNVRFLVKRTRLQFDRKHLETINEQVDSLIEEGRITEAEHLITNFRPLKKSSNTTLTLNNPKAIDNVRAAFNIKKETLITYPKQLGHFWNNDLIRGAFVMFLASEKRGKSYRLMEMALRAAKQGRSVAYFQAGDMSEAEQLIRMASNLTGRPTLDKYCGKMFQPVRDCVLNQVDKCTKKERECDFGIFDDRIEKVVREEITLEEIIEAQKDYPEYSPCHNCDEYWENKLGAVWMEEIDVGAEPLTEQEAVEAFNKFFIKHNRKIKMDTRSMGELTLTEINIMLDKWYKEEGFEADVIVIDYADLIVYDGPQTEFRHKVNYIWQGLRGISQKRQALVITATQADAKSFDKKRLSLTNFSEDKRKFGHVTAAYGLNQDPHGREKRLGLMVINKLILRGDDFDVSDEVYVLQNLRIGRPFLGSYY